MSPLVEHLCKIRNGNAKIDSDAERTTRPEKINALIRKNQINAARNENTNIIGDGGTQPIELRVGKLRAFRLAK